MAKHFIGVEDYKISPEWKAPSKKTTIALTLTALYLVRKYCSNKKSKRGGSSWQGSRFTQDNRQKCTVKMHYSKNLDAHKEQLNRYLVKEGKGKDGGKPILYGTDLEEYKKNMRKKNFRIFLSPASNKVPLDALAKTFVTNLETQTGFKFYWIASEHYDTAHHHVHLLINGIDKNGKDVFIPRDVVKTYMRENARNICTSLIGNRTVEEIKQEKEDLLQSNRFTYLDTNIESKLKNNTFFMSQNDSESVRTRLDHLAHLGLCRYKDNSYIFSKDWDKTLKTNGRYNSFLQSRKELQYTNEINLELYDTSKGTVSGIVTKIYKTDEVSDNHALLVEGIDGKAYFVPLFYKPKNLNKGDTIQIEPKENQKGRLTPTISFKSNKELYNEVKRNGFKKGFAEQVCKENGDSIQR